DETLIVAQRNLARAPGLRGYHQGAEVLAVDAAPRDRAFEARRLVVDVAAILRLELVPHATQTALDVVAVAVFDADSCDEVQAVLLRLRRSILHRDLEPPLVPAQHLEAFDHFDVLGLVRDCDVRPA